MLLTHLMEIGIDHSCQHLRYSRMSCATCIDISRKSRVFYKTMIVNNLANRDPSCKVSVPRDQSVALCS